MKVAVLGSGVVGVSTAWFLARAGHEVVVLDRASGPARETSFANGGQISVSQSEPWANPSAPWQIIKWLLRDDAPLLFRLRLDPAQWRWCWQFLLECRGSRAERNMRQMLALGRYSRDTLQMLRAELNLDYQQQTRGIVSLFHTQRQLDEAAHVAAQMRELGMDKHIISREELARIEPALAGIAPRWPVPATARRTNPAMSTCIPAPWPSMRRVPGWSSASIPASMRWKLTMAASAACRSICQRAITAA
jgi:D-amino-acid dehydrogenase